MRRVGSVLRFLSVLWIIGVGLASVAQGAGADRKAARAERERRVLIAERARLPAREGFAGVGAVTNPAVQKSSVRTAARLSPSQTQFVQRLVSATMFALKYENEVIVTENRLIATQNRVISQLNNSVNPARINALQQQALALQASIDRNLTFITAISPPISGALTAIEPFVGAGPGIAGAFFRLQTNAARDDARAAAIAARPPFVITPATPTI